MRARNIGHHDDVDTLTALGLLATTNPCGTRFGWRPAFSRAVAGRHIAVLPRRRRAGPPPRSDVAAALAATAASVVVVDLFGGRRGTVDVTDWLAGHGNDADRLVDQVRQARYQSAGYDRAPRGADKWRVLFASALTATEKLVLAAVKHHLEVVEHRMPTAAETAAACSLHRVTAQNTLTALRRRGVLARTTPGIGWDVLCVTRPAARTGRVSRRAVSGVGPTRPG